MTIYIALLRGINVGGKNKIKMVELKRLLEAINLSEVRTYIQSGNILFKSDKSEEYLCNKIEHEIHYTFGVTTKVILRTKKELEELIFSCPFSESEIKEAEMLSKVKSLYVSLLASTPLKENIEIINTYTNDNDKYKIIGRDVYLLFSNSIRNSKLSNNLSKLGVPSTVRNWETLYKLVTIAREM